MITYHKVADVKGIHFMKVEGALAEVLEDFAKTINMLLERLMEAEHGQHGLSLQFNASLDNIAHKVYPLIKEVEAIKTSLDTKVDTSVLDVAKLTLALKIDNCNAMAKPYHEQPLRVLSLQYGGVACPYCGVYVTASQSATSGNVFTTVSGNCSHCAAVFQSHTNGGSLMALFVKDL